MVVERMYKVRCVCVDMAYGLVDKVVEEKVSKWHAGSSSQYGVVCLLSLWYVKVGFVIEFG